MERSVEFLFTFRTISVALQKVLRERIPKVYFENSEAFRDLKTAYPMLVYQASRPYRSKKGIDLTYDVMNPEMLPLLLRKARPGLTKLLRQVAARLRAEGRKDLLEKYTPGSASAILRSVGSKQKNRKWLYLLVRGEATLVDALVEFSVRQRGLDGSAQQKNLAFLMKRWNYQLRRLYPRHDFSWLSPVLMDCATAALRACQARRSRTGSISAAAKPVRIDKA